MVHPSKPLRNKTVFVTFNNSISLNVALESVPESVILSAVELEFGGDEYESWLILSWDAPNANYDKELTEYNKKLKEYTSKYYKYKRQLKKYELAEALKVVNKYKQKGE